MTILTKPEILKAIAEGIITIEPFDPAAVGPGSIDLRLGNSFRVFKESQEIYDVNETLDYRDITTLITADFIMIRPQETILGITQERITLPENMCGWLEGRSRFARLGLMVHISASFMQPGIRNSQVLEMSNMGHVSLRLHAGEKVCQFVFQKMVGKAQYTGRFAEQRAP